MSITPRTAVRAAARLCAAATLMVGALPAVLRAEPPTVGASVAPLAYLARQIGGREIDVMTLIPPGAAPETFAPRPRQLEALAGLRIYLAVGHPGIFAETRHILPLLGEAARVVALADTVGERTSVADDPHLWLSPSLVGRYAERVQAAFERVDPEHAARYRANGAAFRASLERLERELASVLRPLPAPRRFLVGHPAWGWFAADFGLEQVAIEHAGKQPGPRGLIPLIERARADGIRRILVQPGTPHRTARLVADEIGATLHEADPLAADWAANLRSVAHLIAAGP